MHKVSLNQILQEALKQVTWCLLACRLRGWNKVEIILKNKTKKRTSGCKDRDGRKSTESHSVPPPAWPSSQGGTWIPALLCPAQVTPTHLWKGPHSTGLSHTGLSWSKFPASSLESQKHFKFKGNLDKHRINCVAACKSSTPSSFMWESFPASRSRLWQGIIPQ